MTAIQRSNGLIRGVGVRQRGRGGAGPAGAPRRMSPSAPGGTREGGGRRRTPRGFQPAWPAGSATKTGSSRRRRPRPGVSRPQRRCFGTSNLSDAAPAREFRCAAKSAVFPFQCPLRKLPPGDRPRAEPAASALAPGPGPWRRSPSIRSAVARPDVPGRRGGQRLNSDGCKAGRCSIPNFSSSWKPFAGTWTSTFHGPSSTLLLPDPRSRRRRSR